jgi:hypothetical protein
VNEIPMILEREAGRPDYEPQVAVRFVLIPEEDKEKSEKAGSLIYVEREYVNIRVPGDKQSDFYHRADKPMRASDGKERLPKDLYPKAYEIFKRQSQTPMEGTPLEHWPQISRALALTLKAAGIHTVEMLAEVHDGNLEKLPHNIREIRQKARTFLATAKDAAMAQERARENEELKAQLAEMKAQIAALSEKRGPGRPPKESHA